MTFAQDRREVRRRAGLWPLAALSLLLLACDGAMPLIPGSDSESPEYGSAGSLFSVQVLPVSDAGLVRYRVRLTPRARVLGAYQATFSFASASLDLVSVTNPSAREGEQHVVNAATFVAGEIRFAGYSLSGFAESDVLEVVVRRWPRGGDVHPHVRLELAADTGGVPISPKPGAARDRPSRQFSASASFLPGDFIGLLASSQAQVRVDPGASLQVPVIVEMASAGALNLASLEAQITWRADRLTFGSLQPSVPAGWSFAASTGGAAAGTVGFTTSGATPVTATTTLATANFTAGSSTGGTILYVTASRANNSSGASIANSLRSRALAVCVAPPSGLWGDVTADGVVNIVDAQQLARYGVGLSVVNPTAVATLGDVTADGFANIIDAQQVARFGVGLSASPRTGTPTFIVPPTTAITTVSSLSLPVGASYQIDARTFGGESTGCTFTDCETTGCSSMTWTTSNPGVAVVNATGLVSAVAPGTATITVTSDGVALPLQVTVVP